MFMFGISEEFDNEARKIREEPETIEGYCHYTSLESLEAILSNGYLRMTHFKYLNDPEELIFSKKIFDENFNNQPNINIIRVWEQAKKLLKQFQKDTDFYVFSLSKPDYLPSWRWYGDDGYGVSISFKKSFFEIVAPENCDKEESPYVLTSVDYGESACRETWEKFTELLAKYLNPAKSLNNEEKNEIITRYALHLFSLLPSFKHFDYQHEEETRFYRIHVNKKNVPKFLQIPEHIKDFYDRRRKRQIECGCFKEVLERVPYIKKNICKDDINEIILGPGFTNFNKGKAKVKQMLERYGYPSDDVHISHSASTYKG